MLSAHYASVHCGVWTFSTLCYLRSIKRIGSIELRVTYFSMPKYFEG